MRLKLTLTPTTQVLLAQFIAVRDLFIQSGDKNERNERNLFGRENGINNTEEKNLLDITEAHQTITDQCLCVSIKMMNCVNVQQFDWH